MGAEATLKPGRLPVAPGGEARTEIAVRNNGPVVDSFALSVLGEAAGWASCEPAALSLFPGQDATAQVLVRPPMRPDVPYGPVPFAVRVLSSEDPPGSVVEEGVLDIAALPLIAADMSPRTGRARGMRASRHRLAVDNRGNATAIVELAGADEADTVQVLVTPAELEVPPGSAAFARVRASARHRFWRGSAVSHRFRVTSQLAGEDPVSNEGTLLQEAVLPSWLPKAVALTAAAAVALATLWLTVLRPVVTNAATSAGTAAAQQVVHQALQAGTTGTGSGQGTPGGSASPATSPATGQASPAPAAAVPFAQDLDAGNPTVTAPAGHSLALTDLVMQNPAGDQGVLTLSRDGQVLFTEQLADFRDYDLHFITAIMLTAGQNFQFSVSCQNQGGKACTPTVLVTGTSSAVS